MSSNQGETTGGVDAQNGGQNQSESNSNNSNEAGAPAGLSELDLLKGRAKMMGITFSNNIGIEALKTKIQAKMDGTPDTSEEGDKLEDDENNTGEPINPLDMDRQVASVGETKPERPLTLREYIQQENLKLVRCRITNLDPKKKDLPGEIVTVANEFLGTVRKFVPFGEHTDEGFHIPFCIYEMLRNRKFLNIRTTRDRRTGAQMVSQNWAPEFALEVLEPLTRAELAQLAQAQIAAGSLDGQSAA